MPRMASSSTRTENELTYGSVNCTTPYTRNTSEW
jgi:hypothetical protein